MKYKLIHKQTGEEHLCDKVVIDGWDYYVSDFKSEYHPKEGWFFKFGVVFNLTEKLKNSDWREAWFAGTVSNLTSQYKKVIATNNPNINVPKVVDIVEELAYEYYSENEHYKAADAFHFKNGYNKSQETHPFSEEDMIDFIEWVYDEDPIGSTPEIVQLWKEQRTKTLYYE